MADKPKNITPTQNESIPSSLKYLTGVRLDSLYHPTGKALSKTTPTTLRPSSFPPLFSTRDLYPNCISPVRNQGNCGSCWALTAADVMQDRLCIHQGIKLPISAQPLISCAGIEPNGRKRLENFSPPECLVTNPERRQVLQCACGDLPTQIPPLGCAGASMEMGWEYLKNYGTVPDLLFGKSAPTISCRATCTVTQGFSHVFESVYLSLKNSTIPASSSLTLQDKDLLYNIEMMKGDLMAFGPIQGAFSVYQSFYDFFDKEPKGVYFMDPSSKPLGGHTSKIVGWGTLKDEPVSRAKDEIKPGTQYWILQNTWGTEWGDEGFYKMAMTRPEDLEALTKAKAFVIEYNAMASLLSTEPALKLIGKNSSPHENPKVSFKRNIYFWCGVGLSILLLLGLFLWLLLRQRGTKIRFSAEI